MANETGSYDVVEVRLDGDLIAEAPLPVDADAVEVSSGDSAPDESILGATPAETPDVAVEEPSTETPQDKYARLISEGYKPAQIEVVTGKGGTAVEVRLA